MGVERLIREYTREKKIKKEKKRIKAYERSLLRVWNNSELKAGQRQSKVYGRMDTEGSECARGHVCGGLLFDDGDPKEMLVWVHGSERGSVGAGGGWSMKPPCHATDACLSPSPFASGRDTDCLVPDRG